MIDSLCSQRGFTYLWLLLLLAIAAAGLAAIAQPIKLAAQRDREAELEFRGGEIARALGSYRDATPGEGKQLPTSLEQLLADHRGPRELHHLRRLYADPFTNKPDWALVQDEAGHVEAIHSRSSVIALHDADLHPCDDKSPVPVSARIFLAPAPAASTAGAGASAASAGPSP